jgi:hypothetical protein
MINETGIIMHLAAQYLAAANINFVAKESDDSHTNIGFNVAHQRLETHALSPEGDILTLSYKEFSLQWISSRGMTSFLLEGKTHAQALQWLEQTSMNALKKPFAYSFHYDLPYAISSTYQFTIPDAGALEKLCSLRILAQHSLEPILKEYQLDASIRIWPHHFDTGIYANLTGTSDVSIGLGLAIPDSVSDTHYFYVSGYKGGEAIIPNPQEKLSQGTWIDQDFKGAILVATNLEAPEAIPFFQATLLQYKRYNGN